jgi:hypothetical protein
VTIIIGETEIPAHSSVLCAKGDYTDGEFLDKFDLPGIRHAQLTYLVPVDTSMSTMF